MKKPASVSFVEAAGCIGDAVKAYTALHYLGRMCSGETGNKKQYIYIGNNSFFKLLFSFSFEWCIPSW